MDKKKFFQNRWLIKGSLVTDSLFHTGGGEVTTRGDFKNEKDGKPIDIAAVVTDHKGCSYIPGSTIKGTLRSWLRQRKVDAHLIEGIFGSEKKKQDDYLGGKVEFYDAFVAEISAKQKNPPFLWDKERFTGVAAHCAIDRHTRAARKKKLFHHEFVPAGVKYDVKVAGQDLSDEEVICLLGALNGFHADDPVTLGVSTVNGYGRFKWERTELRKIDVEGVKKWVKAKAGGIGYEAMEPVSASELSRILDGVSKLRETLIYSR